MPSPGVRKLLTIWRTKLSSLADEGLSSKTIQRHGLWGFQSFTTDLPCGPTWFPTPITRSFYSFLVGSRCPTDSGYRTFKTASQPSSPGNFINNLQLIAQNRPVQTRGASAAIFGRVLRGGALRWTIDPCGGPQKG
jgi:hypothetical protein